MNLTEGFTQSFETIRHNKLRTLLTMLGMNIGVASVIAVMAIGLMGRAAIMEGMESIGSTLLWVQPNSKVYPRGVSPQLMKSEDLPALKELAGDAWMSPILRNNYSLGFRGESTSITAYGVWSDYGRIWGRIPAIGQFVSGRNEEKRERVIVLGSNISKAFFASNEEALGQSVVLGGKEYTVIGVMGKMERAAIDDGADDSTCYVPYTVLESSMNWQKYGGPRVSRIFFKVKDIADLDYTASRIEAYLSMKYGSYEGNPKFTVRMAESNIQTTNKIFDIITTVITLIAGISLVVGGIGIMNIMLVTVTERTREIGIRKAIGAKRRDILAQFLIESVIICLIGGGIGILFGMGITVVVSMTQKWLYVMPWFAIIVGLVVSLCIGLFFGIYPALKAARLDPVVALTKE